MRIISVLLLIFLSVAISAQLSPDARISLLTCGPGDEIYSIFGHTAIRVDDPSVRMDHIYNFGVFDSSDPEFLIKFIRRKVPYQLGKTTYTNFLREYEYNKRTVYEQVLNVDSTTANEIYQRLEVNYLPKNRSYAYDFFFDNCSTRPKDLMSDIIPELKLSQNRDPDLSLRDMLHQYDQRMPWIEWGIDLAIGRLADQKASHELQAFLPIYLMNLWTGKEVDTEPVFGEARVVLDYRSKDEAKLKAPWIDPPLIMALAFLFLWIWYLIKIWRSNSLNELEKIRFAKPWFYVLGVGSLVLLFLWFGTDHIATKSNWNVLWMSPLYLLWGMLHRKNYYIVILGLLNNSAFVLHFLGVQYIAKPSLILALINLILLAVNFRLIVRM